MNKLEALVEEYLFKCMAVGIIRDMEGQLMPNEYLPDIVIMMMNEEVHTGRLSNGLVGYALGQGYDVMELGCMVPREVSLACLEILRPFATPERPDIQEAITRCDRANSKFLTSKDIEASEATNVTQLH